MVWRLTGEKPLPEPIVAQFTDAYMREHKGLWGGSGCVRVCVCVCVCVGGGGGGSGGVMIASRTLIFAVLSAKIPAKYGNIYEMNLQGDFVIKLISVLRRCTSLTHPSTPKWSGFIKYYLACCDTNYDGD